MEQLGGFGFNASCHSFLTASPHPLSTKTCWAEGRPRSPRSERVHAAFFETANCLILFSEKGVRGATGPRGVVDGCGGRPSLTPSSICRGPRSSGSSRPPRSVHSPTAVSLFLRIVFFTFCLLRAIYPGATGAVGRPGRDGK